MQISRIGKQRFIEVGWACKVCKATKCCRYPFQSADLRALTGCSDLVKTKFVLN